MEVCMTQEGQRAITKADLMACRSAAIEVDKLRERIEVLCSAVECVTRAPSGMPRSQGVMDKLAEYVVRKELLQQRLMCRIVDLEERRAVVEDALDALPHRQQLILRLRYIEGVRTWREVARIVHYEERQCRRLHRAALDRLL